MYTALSSVLPYLGPAMLLSPSALLFLRNHMNKLTTNTSTTSAMINPYHHIRLPPPSSTAVFPGEAVPGIFVPAPIISAVEGFVVGLLGAVDMVELATTSAVALAAASAVCVGGKLVACVTAALGCGDLVGVPDGVPG
jgi:hypothetical protein